MGRFAVWVAVGTVAVMTCCFGTAAADRQYAAASGTVTDALTGAPVAGAKLYGPGNPPMATTDQNGRWAMALLVGTVDTVYIRANGYYDQDLGGPPAESTNPVDLTVTATGPNIFNQSIVPDVGPSIGLDPASLSWSHANNSGRGANPMPQPFASMVYNLNYGAQAETPPNWPADTLVLRAVDSAGQDVVPEQANRYPWATQSPVLRVRRRASGSVRRSAVNSVSARPVGILRP